MSENTDPKNNETNTPKEGSAMPTNDDSLTQTTNDPTVPKEDNMQYHNHIILVEWSTNFTTSQIGEQLLSEYLHRDLPVNSVAYMPEFVNLNGMELGEVSVPFTVCAFRDLTTDEQFGPRYLEDGMEPLNFRVKEVTDNPFMGAETPNMNHIYNTNPSEEDTTMADQPTQFTLPIINTKEDMMDPNPISVFEIYFRPDPDTEWDLEHTVNTKIQALQYVANAKLTSGEFKVTSTTDPDMVISTSFTEHDKVYVYAKELDRFDQFVIVTTNFLNAADAKSLEIYRQAFNDNKLGIVRKLQIEAGVVPCVPMATSDSWLRPLLTNRVAKIGGRYRVESYNKAPSLNQLRLNGRIEQASFAYVEADNLTVFFLVDNDNQKVTWDEFPNYLGLEFRNSKKFGKRANELVRLSLYWTVRTGSRKINIHTVDTSEALEMAVDGCGVMSMSFALEMADSIPNAKVRNNRKHRIRTLDIVRVNFRALLGMGLLKGDRIIVPDEVLMEKYGFVPDLVEYTIEGKIVNLKQEIRTDGSWEIATFEPHHAHGPVRTNDQLLACVSKNGTWLLVEDELMEDQITLYNKMMDEVASGKIPAYLSADWITSKVGGFKMDPDQLAARFKNLGTEYIACRSHYSDTPMLESGFLTARNGHGFVLQQGKALRQRFTEKGVVVENNNKVMVPVRWAAYLYVTTLSIIEMCGYNPVEDGYDTSKAFYYPKAHSFVMPDQMFIDNYARHGGYDGDDSLMVIVRKIRFSDGSIKEMAVLCRMPMAWGEYSIVEIDLKDFPFYHTDNEMPVVNHDERPEFLEEMSQVLGEMPYSNVELPDTYSMDWAKYQLTLAVANPGIGQVVNKMIAYYTTALTYFPEQLCPTELFVDITQQEPDMEAFMAIAAEIDRMILEIVNLGLPIDEHIWETRLLGVSGDDIEVTKDGFFSRMINFSKELLTTWEKRLDHLATHERAVIQEVMDLELPETIMITRNGEEVETNLKAYVAKTYDWFVRMSRRQGGYNDEQNPGYAKREFWAMLNRKMVKGLINQRHRHIIMAALYQHIISNGLKDNILFQTPMHSDEMSTMHLWLDALYRLGLADKFRYDEETGLMHTVHPNTTPEEVNERLKA